jgi:hypothetical protein
MSVPKLTIDSFTDKENILYCFLLTCLSKKIYLIKSYIKINGEKKDVINTTKKPEKFNKKSLKKSTISSFIILLYAYIV